MWARRQPVGPLGRQTPRRPAWGSALLGSLVSTATATAASWEKPPKCQLFQETGRKEPHFKVSLLTGSPKTLKDGFERHSWAIRSSEIRFVRVWRR